MRTLRVLSCHMILALPFNALRHGQADWNLQGLQSFDGLLVYEVKAKYRLKFDRSSRRIRPPDAGRFHAAFEHIRSVTSKWLNARHWPPDRLRFGGARHNYSRRILW